MAEIKDQINSVWLEIKETIRLNLDYAKLTGAEKITVLLSMVAVGLIALILISLFFFFLSMALVMLIAKSTGIFGACMIMAGVYVVLVILLFALKRKFIVDPISRFVSHLILK